jgi:hypothetical protein
VLTIVETVSVPFSASYGTSAADAFGKDRLTVAGGAVIVIGNAPAAVEVRGILRTTADTLEIEYRATRAQVLGIVSVPEDTGLQTASVPLSAVASVTLKRGLLRKPRLIVEFNRLDVVPAMPWSETTRLIVTIERRHAERARELSLSLRMMLADADLKRLGSE